MTVPRVKAQPRRESPLGGAKPTRQDLNAVDTTDPEITDDVLPVDPEERLRLLICGINPGLWTAAVNAPFARPGNRFWPSLYRAGMLQEPVDVSAGMSAELADELVSSGIGMTNLVQRATVRADQLSTAELREGGQRLIRRVGQLRPAAVAIAGITAFRTAYHAPQAQLGRLSATDRATYELLAQWPDEVQLWVVPQPSGLNAHENVDTLADKWRTVLAGLETDRPQHAD
ncbi:mismatch-specific DNA-glycosylase [Auritidibacter ignavus]|uniref:Mismatch-specific DNA-glycosylase n=1 Tax=Auritidibacter ignavus TaxID=678932 RepID=A0AAJ6DBZ3_9MICC|nr:mismatch-specific DNA-glycosylase [Auritidibacter ignavus]NIH71226.1 TDG/mug DNA glycosylase family protein [Auritidibacter ignavus]RMX22785.1 mismatch-specific DNA-glycosylase [Auritidibacter ignavus]WGH90563.1 mismatch-specific DNA-glycosylase [Auritidibacter ignavus]WGH92939.1 mismatch-specific DNA-glycosylase [Auritidibacter ignavus]WHS28710.1 mismatch-specific DNA-glycosylase [Auritidibacter ignavus]